MVVAAQVVLVEGEVGKETKARATPTPRTRAARDPGREEVVMARCDARDRHHCGVVRSAEPGN